MKTAMIWGAAGGIGRALIEKLSSADWNVIAIARDVEAISERAALRIEADVSSEYQVQNAVLAAGYEFDQVELWIYCVGDIMTARVSEMAWTDFQRILKANLSGAFLATQHSLPLVSAKGHLFYLGAVSERMQLPSLAAYAAAKAGLEAFAAALAKEERHRRVTVVRPGAVKTTFWEKVPFRMPRDAAPAGKVAQKIIQAYDEGHSGHLDLV